MATSGSKDYSITRADIIEGALRRIGVYDQGDSVPGEENKAAAFALNLMVKEWVARGIDIWLRKEVTVFLQPGSQSYLLGSDHATITFAETTLTTSASGLVLDVASSSDMSVSDFIGIKLDDNSLHWDTIASVDTATQVTITTGLPSNASSGKKVYAYTTKAGRPQKILYAFRRDTSDFDTEVTIVGENEYYEQSNKGSSGPPVEVRYRPTLDNGTLYVWPTDGGSSYDKLVLVAQYLPDDFDDQDDTPEFPIEWGNALVWNLAAELASEYGIPEREQGRLWRIAEHKLEELLSYDVENASVVFAMDYA